MVRKSNRRMVASSVFALMLLSACGSSSSNTAATPGSNTNQGEFTFGEPGDSANADRVIEIVTTNDLVFSPADLTVTAGETIKFRIVNDATIIHDFTLGDEATQEEHEQEMAEGGMAHDQANAIAVAAGETKELTWTFTEPGSVLIGCHQPGHYDAGMKGQITVEA
jgi:uncharacterized cupredoxin-like copper-binding protein